MQSNSNHYVCTNRQLDLFDQVHNEIIEVHVKYFNFKRKRKNATAKKKHRTTDALLQKTA